MSNFDRSKIDWQKCAGLLPAIVQHVNSGQVLMLGFMNSLALEQTLKTQKVTFYSRTKQALWVKGETSGHYLQFHDCFLDCDSDALLILAMPAGPTCHRNTAACFHNDAYTWQPLRDLENKLIERRQQKSEDSYTVKLLEKGIHKVAQKVGEEATETVIAALVESDERVCNEAADLLYHLLVLLQARNLSIAQVFSVLHSRQ